MKVANAGSSDYKIVSDQPHAARATNQGGSSGSFGTMLVTRSARAIFGLAGKTRALARPVRLLGSASLIFGAMGLRYMLFGAVPTLPYLFFIPAILTASVLFGRGAGLFAILLSVLGVVWVITPDHLPFGISPNLDPLALSIFTFVCTFMWLVIQALSDAFTATDKARAEAEAVRKTRDLLLVELGHRTKNDMARIMSMMVFQAADAEPAVKEALRIAGDRVATMARIHDRIQMDDSRLVVDSNDCLAGLVDDLNQSLAQQYHVELSVSAESHILPATTGGALGLITNEIAPNALKHAFPDGQSGAIQVTFLREGDHFVLRVTDNGVGHAATPTSNGSGKGSKIIRALTKQLGGTLVTSAVAPGTETVLRFPATSPEDDGGHDARKRPMAISALPISVLA